MYNVDKKERTIIKKKIKDCDSRNKNGFLMLYIIIIIIQNNTIFIFFKYITNNMYLINIIKLLLLNIFYLH